jgi:hypothetical protein
MDSCGVTRARRSPKRSQEAKGDMRKNKENGDGLNGRIQQFVEQNPDGWSDEDWVRFLAELGEAGLDTSDPDALGLELERARLLRRLQTANIKGLGPRRIATVAERYGTL